MSAAGADRTPRTSRRWIAGAKEITPDTSDERHSSRAVRVEDCIANFGAGA